MTLTPRGWISTRSCVATLGMLSVTRERTTLFRARRHSASGCGAAPSVRFPARWLGKHRDGRRDQCVAVEESCRDHAQQKQHELRSCRVKRPLSKRHQEQCALRPCCRRGAEEHILAVTTRMRAQRIFDSTPSTVPLNSAHAAKRERPERMPLCLALSAVFSRSIAKDPRHSMNERGWEKTVEAEG